MALDLDQWMAKLLHNKGLKLIALVLAAVTWYYIQDATSFEDVIRDVPVNIIAPEGWAPQESYEVTVAFRGSQADIRNLDQSQIRVVADISNREVESTMQVVLRPSSVQSPRAVRVVEIRPSEIQVTLDRGGEAEVMVEVNKVGEPAQGFLLGDFTVNPDRVRISGPRRFLAGVTNVFTRPVELDGRTRSFSRTVALDRPRELPGAILNPAEVTVNFTITEITMDRLIEKVPVRLLLPPGTASRYALDPAEVNITLQGRVNLITNIAPQAIHAFVNVESVAPGSATAELPVEVTTGAPGVRVLMVAPAAVRLIESDAGP